MPKKLSYKPIRAIKTPLKFLLLGVFVFLGLLFTNEAVLGATMFEDNFDSYEIGHQLNEYNGWENSTDNWIITDEYCYSGKCIFTTTSTQFARRKGTELATGSFSFWFYFENEPTSAHQVYFYDDLTPSAPAQLTNLRFEGNEIKYYATGLTYPKIFEFTTSTWHSIIADFDVSGATSTIRFNFDGDWTNWLDPAYDRAEIDRVDFFKSGGVEKWKIDEIAEFGKICQFYQTYLTCQNAGCCWYYSTWFYEYFCVECPIGECGSGPYECQNCLTEENCEAQDLCYWFEGVCKFGTGSCGEGLELQFCENQTDCENAGGYWYEDFCWLSAKVDLTSWEDYYSEYGDYATPSAWITNVASTTSLFLGQMGGFLSIFEKNFDLKEAFERGKNFGEVIPKARGYLDIFNNFLGGFPIGEFFVFLLIFMLAVGVFRIMRNLFQLIKFW